MAGNTMRDVRSLVIYEVYPRNYGPTGTFKDIEADLERIRGMGVDVIWLMPIHPIGKVERKGKLGSPYAISDYRAVNPEYGTLEDFRRLVEKAHGLGLKVMIDVVYNHTAPDSVLVREHPEWFHQDELGAPYTTVPDWRDIIDLKHPNTGLEGYLIDSLVYWATQGVDGFRCDVASLVPASLWKNAREAVEAVRPGVIWLAETIHAGFVEYRRAHGLFAQSDGEIFQAFDLGYDYDIWPIWQQAVLGEVSPLRYLEMLRYQDAIYPANYAKLRCVENHDQVRIMALAPSRAQALAWTALAAFNKGAFLIYNGLEAETGHTPTLFDRDPVEWKDYPLQGFLTRLAALKKHRAVREGVLVWTQAEPVVQGVWYHEQGSLYGAFNVSQHAGEVEAFLADGRYRDWISGEEVEVRGGKLRTPESAVVVACNLPAQPRPFFSPLIDFHRGPEAGE